MPEVVEAEILVRGLQHYISKEIVAVEDDGTEPNNILVGGTLEFNFGVKGLIVVEVIRRGKRPIFILEDSKGTRSAIGFFLGMSGTFSEEATNVSRIGFHFSDNSKLFFQDARKWARITHYQNVDDILNHGGDAVDPLGANALDIYTRLWEHRPKNADSSMKEVLMDQSVLIGLGNYYAQEVLWLANIKPSRPHKFVRSNEMIVLSQYIEQLLTKSLIAGGLSLKNWHHVDGTKGKAQDLGRVYGKKYCECGSSVAKEDIGGRSTYYCTRCQK